MLLLSMICLFQVTGWVVPVAAELDASLRSDARGQFEFAESLFRKGDYFRAVTEYQRFVHFFPDHALVPAAMLETGKAFYNSERYIQAVETLADMISRYGGCDLAAEAYGYLADSQAALKRPDLAIASLERLARTSQDPRVRETAWYRIGWQCLEGADFTCARNYFERLDGQSRHKYNLAALIGELGTSADIPRKNPRTAGALALVPGAGYLYTQRPRDALVALVLNGALFLAAWEAFDNDLPVLGSLAGVVGLGFYSGSIYGSISSAHKYNQARQQDFIERLKSNFKIQLSGRRSAPGLLLSWRIPF